jgi:hypothetical protein
VYAVLVSSMTIYIHAKTLSECEVLCRIRNMLDFTLIKSFRPLPTPSWRSTPCRLVVPVVTLYYHSYVKTCPHQQTEDARRNCVRRMCS